MSTGEPLRVLMTADTVGGVWTYAMELTRALGPQVQVTLAAMGGPVLAHQREEAEAAGAELYESEFRLEWMDDPWADIRQCGEWLLDLSAQVQPDIVHLNQYAYGALPFEQPTLVVGHSCVLSWWRAVQGCAAPREWERYRDVVASGLRGADLVVAPSQAMLDCLRLHYRGALRGRVVYNGIDASGIAGGPKDPLIFSAGRVWDEAKNIAALASVAHELPWPTVIAGNNAGGDGSRYHESAACMLGQISNAEVRKWMASAGIYVMPARYEPFGLSILEAAHARCALVLGDIPSLRELWQGAAAFVPLDDAQALVATITEIAQNASLRETLGEQAAARAARYSAVNMADNYYAAYHALLKRAGAVPMAT